MLAEGDFVTNRDDIKTDKEAKIARACPARMTLERGKDYLYCTCGLSKYQPFCDGTHKDTDFKPLKVTITKS